MFCARGKILLMADADAATQFKGVEGLEKHLADCIAKSTPGIAIGSRAHMSDDQTVQVSFKLVYYLHCNRGHLFVGYLWWDSTHCYESCALAIFKTHNVGLNSSPEKLPVWFSPTSILKGGLLMLNYFFWRLNNIFLCTKYL